VTRGKSEIKGSENKIEYLCSWQALQGHESVYLKAENKNLTEMGKSGKKEWRKR
jgi:hypothetical protein